MNDHDAMDAINAVLDRYYDGELGAAAAVNRIARITGENKVEHAEARQAKS